MLLEAPHRREELVEGFRELLLHRLDRLGCADSGDHVLALGIREELAEEPRLARRGVAGEGDARPRGRALVAEDHLDDVDRGAEVVGDPVSPAVHLRPGRVPRLEDRLHGAGELLARVLRERRARLFLVDLLVGDNEVAEVVRVQLDVLLGAAVGLEIGERGLEAVRVDALDHLAVHLDQAPVGVAGEAGVVGRAAEPFDGVVVQTEVEDRVHHPGHRDRGSRAHRDEQRVGGVAEALACRLLERVQVLLDLWPKSVRQLLSVLHVGTAGVGRDRESGGDRHAQLRHLGQTDALAAEELAPALGWLVESEDEAPVPSHNAEVSHRAACEPCAYARGVRVVLAVTAATLLAGAGGNANGAPAQGRIAFGLEHGSVSSLYTVRPNGTGLRRVTVPPTRQDLGGDTGPAWSPDGRRLVFERNLPYWGNDRFRLNAVPATGGIAKALTQGPST